MDSSGTSCLLGVVGERQDSAGVKPPRVRYLSYDMLLVGEMRGRVAVVLPSLPGVDQRCWHPLVGCALSWSELADHRRLPAVRLCTSEFGRV